MVHGLGPHAIPGGAPVHQQIAQHQAGMQPPMQQAGEPVTSTPQHSAPYPGYPMPQRPSGIGMAGSFAGLILAKIASSGVIRLLGITNPILSMITMMGMGLGGAVLGGKAGNAIGAALTGKPQQPQQLSPEMGM